MLKSPPTVIHDVDDPIAVGNIRMRREAHGRRLRCWFEPKGARIGPLEADAFIAEVTAAAVRPLHVLVEGAGAPDISAEYRQRVGDHFRKDPGCMVVAFTDLPAVIAVIVRMFAIVTRVRVRAFGSEAEAIAWLEAHTPVVAHA